MTEDIIIKKMKANSNPMTLIYGSPGHGKTTLASEFPNPIFIQLEDGGSSEISPDTFGVVKSYDEILKYLRWIYDPKNEHGYKTLVIDGLGDLDKFLPSYVCSKHGWENLEEANKNYGAGFSAMKDEWSEFINILIKIRNKRGMNIVAICHDVIEKFNDPVGVPYDYHGLAINRKMEDYICGKFDNILFLRQDVNVDEKRGRVSGVNIMIHCQPKPTFTAKNRYGLPDKLLFIIGHGYEALSKYFPNTEKDKIEEQIKEIKELANETLINNNIKENDNTIILDSKIDTSLESAFI